MNAQGQTKQLGDKWGASITYGKEPNMHYHEVPMNFYTESQARISAEYVVWTLWAAMVDWA